MSQPTGDETSAALKAAWAAGYEAGADDQAEEEGHRYTPRNRPDMRVTPNPYDTVSAGA